MKRVTCTVGFPEGHVHPVQRAVAEEGPVTRAELLTWSPTADATALLWCDADREATASVVSTVGSVVERHLVADGDDGTYAFLRQDGYEFSDALLAAIAECRVLFLPPVVFHESGAVAFEAVGESRAVSDFHAALTEVGEVTVERVRAFERDRSRAELTARQRAALEAARELGYYEVPREASVADVATALDCSTSTAGELLRRAEAAVVEGVTGEP
jgi:predicted DNA binding protein